MRIIVTKNGKHILKEIEDEKDINLKYNNQNNPPEHTFKKFRNFSCIKLPLLTKNYSTLKNFYETNKNKRWGKSPCFKKGTGRKTMDNYFNRDESQINKNDLDKAKKIKLTKNKINISQQFLDKYDDLDITYKDKINKLTNTLKSKVDKNKEEKMKNELMKNDLAFKSLNPDLNNKEMNSENTSKILSTKNKILLGDIISVNNLINMRKMLSKDNTGPEDIRIPLNDQNKDSFNFR